MPNDLSKLRMIFELFKDIEGAKHLTLFRSTEGDEQGQGTAHLFKATSMCLYDIDDSGEWDILVKSKEGAPLHVNHELKEKRGVMLADSRAWTKSKEEWLSRNLSWVRKNSEWMDKKKEWLLDASTWLRESAEYLETLDSEFRPKPNAEYLGKPNLRVIREDEAPN